MRISFKSDLSSVVIVSEVSSFDPIVHFIDRMHGPHPSSVHFVTFPKRRFVVKHHLQIWLPLWRQSNLYEIQTGHPSYSKAGKDATLQRAERSVPCYFS